MRAAFGKSAVRRGKKLTCVGSLERDEDVRLHGHFCLDRPTHLTDEQFHGLESVQIPLPLHRTNENYRSSEQLDQASIALGWTRMALIRRCIIRDMQYILQQEIPRIVNAQELDDHPAWLSRTMRPLGH